MALVFDGNLLAAEVTGMQPADLPESVRNQMLPDLNQFKAEFKPLTTEDEKLATLKRWWDEKKLPAPGVPNTPEQNAANLLEIVSTLASERNGIHWQIRTTNAPEFKDLAERKVASVKAVVFTAFVSENKERCLKLPELFETDRSRTDVYRDDYFSCLVVNDLISQCDGSENLGEAALLKWKRFAKAPNPSLRLICLLSLQSMTQSTTDRQTVLDEFTQEQNGILIDVFVDKTSMLPLANRQALLTIVRTQNGSLSNDQKSRIDSILSP